MVLIVFVIPILLLMFYEFEISVFDKHINIHQYPQFYRKGLYSPKEDETEKIDTPSTKSNNE